MLANLGLAAAFCARARALGAGPAALCWAILALLFLAGLVLAGSVGGFVALIGTAGFAAFAFASLGRGRGRVVAAVVLLALAAGTAGLGVRFLDDRTTGIVPIEGPAAKWPGGAALRYVAKVDLQRPSVQSRFAAWEAGLAGFADRPLLGWGPGNFNTVFGLYGSGLRGDLHAPRSGTWQACRGRGDHGPRRSCGLARNVGARTGGVPACGTRHGAARPRVRGVRRRGARRLPRAAAVHVRHCRRQSLQHTLACVRARLESRALPPVWRARLPARAEASIAVHLRAFRRRGARVALAAAAVALALSA